MESRDFLLRGNQRFQKIAAQFHLNYIRTDGLRYLLIDYLEYYHDADYSYPTPKINSANRLVDIIRDAMVVELLEEGQSVLLDSCGKSKKKRKHRFNLARKAGKKIKTILIYVTSPDHINIARLKKRTIGKNGLKVIMVYGKMSLKFLNNQKPIILFCMMGRMEMRLWRH